MRMFKVQGSNFKVLIFLTRVKFTCSPVYTFTCLVVDDKLPVVPNKTGERVNL